MSLLPSSSRLHDFPALAATCAAVVTLWGNSPVFAGGGGGGGGGSRNWVGGGSDSNWNTAENWEDPEDGDANTAPDGGEVLTFQGNSGTNPNSNLGVDFEVIDLLFGNDGSPGQTASFNIAGDRIEIGAQGGGGGTVGTSAVVTGPPITDTITADLNLWASEGGPGIEFQINSNHDLIVLGNVLDTTGDPLSPLRKTGVGTLVFEGDNGYQGITEVNSGTLMINGSQTNERGLTVDTGATLGGTGSIGGLTTIEGLHSPGTSPGIQSFEDLTYDGGNLNWELVGNTTSGPGTNFDRVQVSGDLAFLNSSTVTLDFSTGVDWSADFWGYNIHEWQIWGVGGTTTGFPDQLSIAGGAGNVQDSNMRTFAQAISDGDLPSTAQLYLFENNNSIYLRYEAALPEPTTFGLLGLVLAALTGLARPRRRLDA